MKTNTSNKHLNSLCNRYFKIPQEEAILLRKYCEEELKINFLHIGIEQHLAIYNTMSFNFYKLNYYFKKLGAAIKKDFTKLLNIRGHKNKK